MSLPGVVLVGRVNVGKSSLFNRLAGRRIAIEDATPGVTRDRVSTILELSGKSVELTDTGGMGQEDDPFAAEVQKQAEAGIAEAALVLLVADGRDGVTALDTAFARALREAARPVLLVVNKIDTERQEPAAGEFAALGFPDMIAVSATTGRNVAELAARIASAVPKAARAEIPARGIRIAVAGRRNVGKSTWVNAVLGEPRLITSDIPGTTRDAVDVTVIRGNRAFVLVDTAGLRKTKSVQGTVEFYAQARAMAAVEDADAVLFLVDALVEAGRIDRQLAGRIIELAKPVVLGINKWDLVPPERQESFVAYIADRFPELAGCPIVFTSGLAKANVWETMELVWELGLRARIWWDPSALSAAAAAAFSRNLPTGRGGRSAVPALNGVRQVGVNPVRIELHTNDPGLWKPADLRMFSAAIRAAGPWKEIPIIVKPVGAKDPRSKKRR